MTTGRIRLGIIFGGRSGEHEGSVRSARSVIEAADREKYEVVPIAITREGRWLSPAESAGMLPEATRSLLPEAVSVAGEALTIVGDPSRRGLHRLESDGSGASAQRLDVVFPTTTGQVAASATNLGIGYV